MCPKYPKLASRTPRFANTLTICRASKGAAPDEKGPSPTKRATTPPTVAMSESATRLTRQSALPIALTRYGEALPSVSAPIRTPSAIPRPSRNQVAIIFMPGG